jgi:hypothetical protein
MNHGTWVLAVPLMDLGCSLGTACRTLLALRQGLPHSLCLGRCVACCRCSSNWDLVLLLPCPRLFGSDCLLPRRPVLRARVWVGWVEDTVHCRTCTGQPAIVRQLIQELDGPLPANARACM